MNREEIKQALENKEKVRHDNFPKAQWIRQVMIFEKLYIEFQDGYQMDYELFWKNRQTEVWDKDWNTVLIN